MVKNERHDKILELLTNKKYMTVDELVSILHYSPATVRRDLTLLEGLGLLEKSYGGVSLNTRSRPVMLREHDNTSAKIHICRAASQLIKDGDFIFIDGTTTTYFLCDFLERFKKITVVTSNIKLAMLLGERNIPCFVTGGLLCDSTMLSGTYAAELIEKMNFDIAFYSVTTVNEDGFFSISDSFTELVRAALRRSNKNILLYDDSKTRTQGKRNFKNLSCMDTVISNAKFPKLWKSKYEKTEFISVE